MKALIDLSNSLTSLTITVYSCFRKVLGLALTFLVG